MKNIIIIAVLAVACITAKAESFAGSAAKDGVGTNFMVIPAGGGTPVVTYLNAFGSNSTALVNYYYSTNATKAIGTNTTVTCPVASTNGFATAGRIVVLQHAGKNPHIAYERLIVASASGSNIVFTAAPSTAVAAGDGFFLQQLAGSIPTTTTNISIAGSGIISGENGKLLLLDCSGTTNATINAACATYK